MNRDINDKLIARQDAILNVQSYGREATVGGRHWPESAARH